MTAVVVVIGMMTATVRMVMIEIVLMTTERCAVVALRQMTITSRCRHIAHPFAATFAGYNARYSRTGSERTVIGQIVVTVWIVVELLLLVVMLLLLVQLLFLVR